MNTVKIFLDKAKKETNKFGVKIYLKKDREYIVVQGKPISGYFDSSLKEIVCATKKPRSEWLPIFVHEFSHFEQWKKPCKAWSLSMVGKNDASDLLFDWLAGNIKLSKSKLKEIIWKTRMAELDCEKRAVKNIKKYKLPIDVPDYIKKANSYVLFHNYVRIKKRWWKRNHAPYVLKEVYSHFPDVFLKKYTKTAQKYIDLFDQYC